LSIDAKELSAPAVVPQASVVVPARNRLGPLARTLETLIHQDLSPAEYEIIVCDDGSTEEVATVVAHFAAAPVAIRLNRQPRLGPAAARNLGIRLSAAPVVIFVDSDIEADQALVRHLLAALDSHVEWVGAEAALHPIGEHTGVLWDAPASIAGGRYHTAAIAYRRAVLLAVGGFDEDFRLPACEDVELAMRVLARGPIGFVPHAKARHRRRRVTAATHWRWRRHWRYQTILAARYGILAFPGRTCGPFPRPRVAWAALASLPAGRLWSAVKAAPQTPGDACLGSLYALFDIACGLSALPSILCAAVPPRRDYLAHSRSRHP
jgi:glycosyltransferase involved in cell wall biosynthesis